MFMNNEGLDFLLLMNPNERKLTARELSGLSIGAINSVSAGFFGNSLTTGSDPQLLIDKLIELYGISNDDDAIKLIDYLMERGDRLIFSALWDESIDLSPYEEKQKFQYERYLEIITLRLKEMGYLHDDDIKNHSILAWDMGRLVTLVRCYYDCNILDEQKSWHYIEHALSLCAAEYRDWQEFSTGYIIGRAISMENSFMLKSISKIVQQLLEDRLSPWSLVPLRC